MESSHDDLSFFEGHLHVAFRHILEFADEIALLIKLFHRVDTLGANLQEFLIRNSGGLHYTFLKINRMPLGNQGSNITGNQTSTYTSLTVLEFTRNTKNHRSCLLNHTQHDRKLH